MFCRLVVNTLASIKPAATWPSTNDGVQDNSAAVSLLLSFHCPRASVQPGSLGGVLQLDREAALGIALEIASAKNRVISGSLRNEPDCGGYPCAPQHDSARLWL
jgi:hypothetical protein